MTKAMEYARKIEDHYASVWARPFERKRWGRGPLHELSDDFSVLIFRKSPEIWAYGTRAMSQPDDRERIELHLLARPSDEGVADDVVELLTVVAHYHRNGSPLGLGHTVNFGRPWLPRSACTHGLVSLPYLDGPTLEWMEEPEVRFLWLIPITPRELELKTKEGLEALEERFERAQFDYLDPMRSSVV